MLKKILMILSASLSLSGLFSGPVLAMEARDIIQQVLDRDDGHSQFSRQTVATCRYALKNRKLACIEKPRVKVVESASRDFGKNGKDRKSVMIIVDPPSERGIGFLQFDYDDPDRDSDQWMYLSALGKVKRIVSGNDDEPKTGSLFGSEFSYEDTEMPHIDDFNYTLVREEEYRGRDCWVVESIPTPAHARKSNYSRTVQWIDKERLMMLKAEMYDRRGQLTKMMTQSDFVRQDGIWLARKMNMNNVKSRRISTMKLSKTTLNLTVDAGIMTQRTLTDSAFRERMLKKLRAVSK